MSRKYQNLVGALAWIANRDAEAADDLNDGWNEAESQLDRVVVAVQLNQFATAKGVEKAKAELVAACEDGRLIALGHTERNEETRAIPIVHGSGRTSMRSTAPLGRTVPAGAV